MNMYGYSKHMFDLWALREDLYGRILTFKFFNVYGPNEYHKGSMASMVLHMYNQINQISKVKLFRSTDPKIADGEQSRDFIYVKDVARMVVDSIVLQMTGLYNIGTGVSITWKTLADAVFRAMGKEAVIEYIDLPLPLQSQYQNYTQANMDKWHRAWEKLGKKPMQCVSLEEGVFDYVQNYLRVGSRL